MRKMGWTRSELEEHTPFEIEMHYAVRDYEKMKAQEQKLKTDHQMGKMRRAS